MASGAASAAELSPQITEIETYPDMKHMDKAIFLAGNVVKGFGRGSRELGIPTANLEPEALGTTVDAVPAGVYFGWASVGASTEVYKMVMSLGWYVECWE
jgi:riboflavin kinase